ncbi:MAG: D-alanyl-D-alanine carboxypeptidase [Rhizobiaceae bacterium]|nr:D-alanyl-D-alanine carboxypeptidase [Rhizobiaceae bacterium]
MNRRLLLPLALAAAHLATAPALAGPSIVFDVATGKVIESDDAMHRWYPASLTKLMTTYVVFRAIRAGELTFSSPIAISREATKLPPSKMGYKAGSELTVDNALKIIMVKSANDVAASIGDSIGGSPAGFAARMNAEARRLGMTDTHWVNAHGLHDDDQYTSPRDLAILARALRTEFPQYSDYFSIEGLLADNKKIATHNNLIARFDGADGMKTGYTCPSGFNLVASATRNGRTVMAVVLGGKTVEARDDEAAALLARGLAAAPGAGPGLDELKRTASGPNVPDNMFDTLCSKEARAARDKAYKQLLKDIKAGKATMPQPVYAADLGRERRYIPVRLGGATGPVPEHVAQARNAADVPIPSWRPDMPAPVIEAAQGDTAAATE